MTLAYISLGSNLSDPIYQVQRAMGAIARLEGVNVQRCSSLYRSAPWGKTDQPDFINAVLAVETQDTARMLLKRLQAIEWAHGKRVLSTWGPRVIDCDLILFGDEVIHSSELTIPHPYMKARAFVLWPLLEIAPMCVLPTGERVADLIAQGHFEAIEKLEEHHECHRE